MILTLAFPLRIFINTNGGTVHNYSELKKAAKIIDSFTFIQINSKMGCFDFCPETPEHTTARTPKTDYPQENRTKTRISNTIKTFIKNNPAVRKIKTFG